MCGVGVEWGGYQSVFRHFDEIPQDNQVKRKKKFIWLHRIKNLGAGTAGQLSG